MEEDLKTIKRCVSWIMSGFDYQKKELGMKPLKELRAVIRRSDALIPAFVDVLFGHLNRENSDLRLGILLLTNYFFQRSHVFRVVLLDHLQDFMLLTLETDPLHYPLPKPPAASSVLKKEALETIRCWIEKYASGYPKLKNAEKFLATSKNFDFQRSNAELLVERNRAEVETFNRELKARKVTEKIEQLYNESLADVKKCLTECRTAIELVYPRFCPSEIKELAGTSTEKFADLANRLHGFTNQDSINIVIPAGQVVSPTEDNVDLLNLIKDCKVLMELHSSRVKIWLKKLTEIGDSSALTRNLIDLKRDLAEEINRCKELRVESALEKQKTSLKGMSAAGKNDEEEKNSSSDDSDFIDVEEKEGFQFDFTANSFGQLDGSIPKHIIERIQEMEEIDRPGPSGIQALVIEKPSLEMIEDEEGVCPTLPFDLDLQYWGERVELAQPIRKQLEGHPFWSAPDLDQEPTNEGEDQYKTRVMTFVGKMPKIKRRCRARMPSGKLCPRMDRERCPIHGTIIDRDSEGFPAGEIPNTSTSTQLKDLEEEKAKDEEEFLKDVEAATGARLRLMPGRNQMGSRTTTAGRKRNKPEYAKTRERLQSKLFDKRTLKRVSETLRHIQRTKAERRFAHQFNYS